MKIGNGKAIVSIEEYDHLREFKREILDGNSIKISGRWDDQYFAVKTIDELIKEFSDLNTGLKNRNEILEKHNESLEYKNDSQRIEIAQLKSELEDAKKDTFWKWLTRK